MPSNDRDCKICPVIRRVGENENNDLRAVRFLLSPTAVFGGVLKCKIQKKGLDDEEDVLGYDFR